MCKQNKLDRGPTRSSLRDGLSTPYRYPYPHWRPAIGPFCTEFVYPGGWVVVYRILVSVLELIGT